ncbi:hypothetical protein CUT44_23165 [Streptomyces carminius]|uniref:Microtubule/TRAF3 and DISC1 binding protein n=1 Tax=Streptomyces carminius TaxID=2665496 RepID=A0A2M8LU71_9ACTN|nr:AAWKG family protein [Streptomyces carminius]PJE95502.1 hypothetical protein CUT44_23165 [Streptomyces carminius]
MSSENDFNNNDDYWKMAVDMLTGYVLPPRNTLFEELKGNEDIPLMHVRLHKVGGSDSGNQSGFYSVIGWRKQNTDLIIPFMKPSGDQAEDVAAGRSLSHYYAYITILGTINEKIPSGEDILAGVELTSKVLKDGGGWNKEGEHVKWSTKPMTQYINGSVLALQHLRDNYTTVGFSNRGLDVGDKDYVDLTSFTDTAKAFERAVKFFQDSATTVEGWEKKEIGEGSESWAGTGASIFRELIEKLARNYSGYVKQLGEGAEGTQTTEVTIDGYAVSTAPGRALARLQQTILTEVNNLITAWNAWSAVRSPQRWLYDLLEKATDELFTNQYEKIDFESSYTAHYGGGSTTYTYVVAKSEFKNSIYIHGEPYGPPDDMATWKKIGEKAVKGWEEAADAHLNEISATAIKNIAQAFDDAKNSFAPELTDRDKRSLSDIAAKEQAAKEKKDNEEFLKKQKEDYEKDRAAAQAEQDKRRKEYEEDRAAAKAAQEEAQRQAQQDREEAKRQAEEDRAAAKAAQEEAQRQAQQDREEAKAEQKKAQEEARAAQEEARNEAKAAQEEAQRQAQQDREEAKAAQEEARQRAEQDREEAKAEQDKQRQEAQNQQALAAQFAAQQRAESKAEQERQRKQSEEDRAAAKAEQEKEKAEAKAAQEEAQRQAQQDREEAKAEQEKEKAEAKAAQEEARNEAKAAQEEAQRQAQQDREEAKAAQEKEKAEAKAAQEEARNEAKAAQEEAQRQAQQDREEARAAQEEARNEARAAQEEARSEAEKEREEAKATQEELRREALKEQAQARYEAEQAKNDAQEQFQREQNEVRAERDAAEREANEREAEARREYEQAKEAAEEQREQARTDAEAERAEARAEYERQLDEGRVSQEEARAQYEDRLAEIDRTEAEAIAAADEAQNQARAEYEQEKEAAREARQEARAEAEEARRDARARYDERMAEIQAEQDRLNGGDKNIGELIQQRLADLPPVPEPGVPVGAGVNSPYSAAFSDNLYGSDAPAAALGREDAAVGAGSSQPGAPGAPMMPPMMGGMGGAGAAGGGSSGERGRQVLDTSIARPVRAAGGPGVDEEHRVAPRGTQTTSSGMPFMPPMGGPMGGGNGGQQTESSDRERTTWLAEDEDVWGTDEGGAPQALGR